jgi:hypothetical protein
MVFLTEGYLANFSGFVILVLDGHGVKMIQQNLPRGKHIILNRLPFGTDWDWEFTGLEKLFLNDPRG